MAYTFDLNVEVDNQVTALLAWKDSAVLNGGMTVLQSGDGDAIGPTGLGDLNGDVLTVATTATALANNIGNTHAWFRGQWPNGREILFARGNGSGGNNCYIVYSAASGFIGDKYGSTAGGGGSGLTVDHSTPPSAEDGAQIHGGLNMFSTGSSIWDATATGSIPGVENGRMSLHMCWGGADEDYSWYCLDWQHGENWEGPAGGMFMDSLTGVPSARIDGLVIGVIRSGVNWFDFASEVCDGRQSQRPPDNSQNMPCVWVNAKRTAAGDGTGNSAGPPEPQNTMDQKMWGAFVMQLSQQNDPAYDFNHTSTGLPVPANGVIVGLDPISGEHHTFGPAQWWVRRSVSADQGKHGYMGASRLFRFSNRAHGGRDMSDDLNWRFLGCLAARWDGVTGQVII